MNDDPAGLPGPNKGPVDNVQMVMHGRSMADSIIGSIKEPQEMLE